MVTKPIVQDIDNGFDENVEKCLKKFHESAHVVTDDNFVVPSAICLWDDLS